MGGDGVTDAEVDIPAVLVLGDDGKLLREGRARSRTVLRAMDLREDTVFQTKLMVPPAAHPTVQHLSQMGLLSFDHAVDKETRLIQVQAASPNGEEKVTPNPIFSLLERAGLTGAPQVAARGR